MAPIGGDFALVRASPGMISLRLPNAPGIYDVHGSPVYAQHGVGSVGLGADAVSFSDGATIVV